MAETGADFEIEVRDHIQCSINAGDLGIDPALAVVRHKAKYWSDKRQDTIITDVSVELYRPKQKHSGSYGNRMQRHLQARSGR